MGQGINELAEMGDKMNDFKLSVLKSLPALNSMKGAIMATGIGLVIVAVGLLAANWDKVTEAVNGVSAEQKKLFETSQKHTEKEKEKLKLIEGQDNIYKLQGKSETAILNLKIAQTKEVMNAVAADIAHQKGILRSQIAASDRNKSILQGILNSMAQPIKGLLIAIDAIGKALGKNFGLAEGLDKSISDLSSYVFDSKKIEEEGKKSIKTLEDTYTEMKNKQAGYVLATRDLADKERKDMEAKNAELKKLEDQRQEDMSKALSGLLKLKKKHDEEIAFKPMRANATEDIYIPKMSDKQVKTGGVSVQMMEEEFGKKAAATAKYHQKIAKMEAKAAKQSMELADAVNKAMSKAFADTAILVGESIAKMFSGGFSAKDFLSGMLMIVSDFATQLGTAFIGIAASTDAFKVALGGMPGLAIAIGVGLVAVGGAIKAGVSKMSESKPGFAIGSRYVPYDMTAQIHKGEMIIPASENPYANSGGRVMPGGGGGVLALSTSLRGNDIRISAKKTNKTYNRITGRG